MNYSADMLAKEIERLEAKSRNMPETLIAEHRLDADFILIILRDPLRHPRDMEAELREKHRLVYFRALDQLQKHHLDFPNRRKEWAEAVLEGGKNLARLLVETDSAQIAALYEKVSRIAYSRRFPQPTAKALLLMFCKEISSPDSTYITLADRLRDAVVVANFAAAKDFLRDFLRSIGEVRGLDVSRGFRDRLPDDNTPRDPSSIEGDKVAHGRSLSELEKENTDLRTALEAADRALREAREELESLVRESETKAIISFFEQLNSRSYGNLLDQMAYMERYLQDIKSKGLELPAELEPFSATIRLFMKFVRASEVEPIEIVGARKKINLEQSESYDYVGSDFADNNETKEVEIKSPGWRCHGVVISRPVAYELPHKRQSVQEEKDVY